MGSRFCDALKLAYFKALSRVQGEGHEPAAEAWPKEADRG